MLTIALSYNKDATFKPIYRGACGPSLIQNRLFGNCKGLYGEGKFVMFATNHTRHILQAVRGAGGNKRPPPDEVYFRKGFVYLSRLM